MGLFTTLFCNTCLSKCGCCLCTVYTKRKGRQSMVAPETALRQCVVKNFSLSCFYFLCFDCLSDAKTGELQCHLIALPFFLIIISIINLLGLFLITVMWHLCWRDGPLSFCRHLTGVLEWIMNHFQVYFLVSLWWVHVLVSVEYGCSLTTVQLPVFSRLLLPCCIGIKS